MAGPIERVSIPEVQAYLGNSIKRLQEIGATGQMLQLALSMCEYLKDAERWRYVMHHDIRSILDDLPENHSPAALQAAIDEQMGKSAG